MFHLKIAMIAMKFLNVVELEKCNVMVVYTTAQKYVREWYRLFFSNADIYSFTLNSSAARNSPHHSLEYVML